MGIINLAHDGFYMIGAYLAFSLSSLTGSLFVAIVLGTALSVVLGVVLEWALFSHLYKRDHLEQVLLTYGLILVFEELRSIIVGNDVHGVCSHRIEYERVAVTRADRPTLVFLDEGSVRSRYGATWRTRRTAMR
jgi:branched-subunit amino acid ABC-type transport system permease component